MIITKKHLPRRTFLKGLGVAVGLPLLEGMVPAFAFANEAVAKPASRISFVYVPNGIIMDKWTPATVGTGFEMTPILEPLTAMRENLLLLSGLSHLEARSLPGEGAGDHARASASFLTGIHPNKTEGADLRNGISLDQIAAKELSKHTQLASLELALDSTETLGACEPGYSCAYTNTLSWRTPTSPMPMENHPRAVFETLFGDSDTTDAKVRQAQIKSDHSILDFVTQGVSRLMQDVGTGDRVKLSEYLDAIRDVERRIQLAESQAPREMPVLERPVGIPSTLEAHAKLMYDLQVLAFQCDLTRVTTFMMGHEQTIRSYVEIGIPDSHHPLSHHAGDAGKMDKVAKINAYHIKMLAYYLEKLKATPDGDGSLLDHSVVLYGSGLSDGNLHLHDSLPVLLAGGGAGKIKGGRHLRYPKDTPMTNLYGTLLDMVGVPADKLGSASGKVEPLSIA
ncbi:MAG TPA: DUF1552 domain-containing protein [Terriglobales bacterium]|nr:DUF1552 domain-containing protein [Terriglobales bacterium]